MLDNASTTHARARLTPLPARFAPSLAALACALTLLLSMLACPVPSFAEDGSSQDASNKTNVERMQEIVDSYEASEDMAWVDEYLMAYAKLRDAFDEGEPESSLGGFAGTTPWSEGDGAAGTSDAGNNAAEAGNALDATEQTAGTGLGSGEAASLPSDDAPKNAGGTDPIVFLMVFMIILLGALVVVLGLVLLSTRRSSTENSVKLHAAHAPAPATAASSRYSCDAEALFANAPIPSDTETNSPHPYTHS